MRADGQDIGRSGPPANYRCIWKSLFSVSFTSESFSPINTLPIGEIKCASTAEVSKQLTAAMDLGKSHANKTDWCLDFNETSKNNSKYSCLLAITYTIPNSHVRVHDIVILFFNVVFLLFLAFKLPRTVKKLIQSWRLFTILYCMVAVIPVTCVVYIVLAMILSHSHLAVKIFHLILRGTILATEVSVVVFGLTFKFYNDKIYKLAAVMSSILVGASLYTIAQGVMELGNYHVHLVCQNLTLFTHGGMIYLFCSSFLLAVAYLLTYILYLFNLHKRWNLPSKKSFYRYALLLSIVNVIQAVSSLLWYFGGRKLAIGLAGICATAVTTDLYLITFAPVVYWIFLSNYFRMNTAANNADKNVNVDAADTHSASSKWFSGWSLRSAAPILVPSHRKTTTLYEETSKLIHSATPSSVSSYESISASYHDPNRQYIS